MDRSNVAERTAGPLGVLPRPQWDLAIVFVRSGGMKFTSYEANGIAPPTTNSPVMGSLHVVFGIRGAGHVA